MNTANDCRTLLRWFVLTDRQNKQRLITPLPEAPGAGVPGMIRYKDSDGVAGFIDSMWFRDHSKRVRSEELSEKLPVMSTNESQRHFGPLVAAMAALDAAAKAASAASAPKAPARSARVPGKPQGAKDAGKTSAAKPRRAGAKGGMAKPKGEAAAPVIIHRPKRTLEKP